MTTKSVRRAAEMAVIDAAVAMYEGGTTNAQRLFDTVGTYKTLGLDKPGEPAIPNDGPDTSIQAGMSFKDLGKLAKQCFDEILVTVPRSGGDVGGLTVDQLEQIMNRSHQSVSARVNELRNKGWIVDSGRKRLTRSRRSAIIWVPSQASTGRRIE